MIKELKIIEKKLIELMDISNIMDLQHHNILMLFTDMGISIREIKQKIECANDKIEKLGNYELGIGSLPFPFGGRVKDLEECKALKQLLKEETNK